VKEVFVSGFAVVKNIEAKKKEEDRARNNNNNTARVKTNSWQHHERNRHQMRNGFACLLVPVSPLLALLFSR
jgi:hypothetical protein